MQKKDTEIKRRSIYKQQLNCDGDLVDRSVRQASNGNEVARRRGYMAGVIGSLLFGVNAAELMSAENVDIDYDPDKTIEDLSPHEERTLVRKAERDQAIQQIEKELDSRGLEPTYDSLKAQRATYKDKEWRWVRIPYKRGPDESDDELFERKGAVVWNSYEEMDPFGYVTDRTIDRSATPSKDIVKAIGQSNIDLESIDTVPVTTEHTQLTVRGQGLHKAVSSTTVPIVTDESQVSPINSCTCTAIVGNPLTACAPCATIDEDCVIDIATNHSVEIVACGACVGSAGWLTWKCGACIAAILETGGSDLCCWCNSCSIPILC